MSKLISEVTMQKLLELIRTDLGKKVNETDLENMFDAYVTTVKLSEILDGYTTDTELTNGLATKSDTGHKHVKADITDFKESDYAPSSHTHDTSDINMLQSMLANKSQVGHTHKISDVENLQTTLDGKASSTHTHEISDVTNLQTSLNNKSDTGHTHDMLDIDGLTETLGNIHSFDVQVVSSLPSVDTAVERTIYFVPKTDTDTDNVYNEYLLINGAFELIGDTQVDLTNYVTTDKLTTELAKKANETHTHEIADVTNLQTTLDDKINGDSMFNELFGGNASSNQLSSGDDLNNYTNRGMYFSASSTITASLLNCPTTENGGRLEVICLPNQNSVVQKWIQRKGGHEWVRSSSESTGWTAWNKVIKQTELDSATEGLKEQSNLFNKDSSEITQNMRIDYENGGGEYTSSTRNITHYIPIEEGLEYVFMGDYNSNTVTFYNISKEIISCVIIGTDSAQYLYDCIMTAPSGAAYLRADYHKDREDKIFIAEYTIYTHHIDKDIHTSVEERNNWNSKIDLNYMRDYNWGGSDSSNQIPSSADLNTYNSKGVYFIDWNITPTLSNSPTSESNASKLTITYCTDNNTVLQKFEDRLGNVWTRSITGFNDGASWTGWNKTIKQSDAKEEIFEILLDGGSDRSNQFVVNEDLNNYKTRQVIFSESTYITQTLLNCPVTTKAGRLEVMEMYSSNDVVQRWIRRDGVEEWSRNYSDGVWTPWNKTIKESDIVEQSNLYYCNEEKIRTYDGVTVTIQVGTHITINGTDDGTGNTFYSPTINIPLTVGVDYEVHLKLLSGSISYTSVASGDYIRFELWNGDAIADYQRFYKGEDMTTRFCFTAKTDTITQYDFNFPTGVVFDNVEIEMFIRRCSYVRTATNSVDTLEAGQIKLGNYTIVNNGTNDTLDFTYNGA